MQPPMEGNVGGSDRAPSHTQAFFFQMMNMIGNSVGFEDDDRALVLDCRLERFLTGIGGVVQAPDLLPVLVQHHHLALKEE